MAGVAQDVVYPPALNDAPSVHDRNAVGDLDGDANVVRDENNRQPELLLQPAQQQEDLNLHRGVERCRRFIGQQQGRSAR